MNRRDLHTLIAVLTALPAVAVAGNGSTVGAIIDRDGADALELILSVAGFTDGVYDVLVEDGDDIALADAAPVVDAELLGTEAGAALIANGTSSIGYVGNKRYVRLTVVATGVTTGATAVSAVAVKSALHIMGGV